jgi:hypothetical protein
LKRLRTRAESRNGLNLGSEKQGVSYATLKQA